MASLASKLIVFFAVHPGRVIYTGEIVERWAPHRKSVFGQLKPSVDKKLFVGVKKPGDAQMYYEAGPALIELIEAMK